MRRLLALWVIIGVVLIACARDGDDRPAPVIILSATPRPSETATFPPPRPTTIGTPTPTTCAGNEAWVDIYEVQPGDTLGQLAILSGVTIEALRRGNCLANSDVVFIGQRLRVPNTFSLTLANDPQGSTEIITFVRRTATGQDIWAIQANGALPRQITDGLLVWGRPVRSPDRTRVAFRAVSEFHVPTSIDDFNVELPTDVYVVGIDGENVRQIVDQGPVDAWYRSDPVWSLEGTTLAFTEQRGQLAGALIAIDPDGANRRVILSGDLTAPGTQTPHVPAWSPDGTVLAVVTWDDELATVGTVQPIARAGYERILVTGFAYGQGPFWVPFEGVNGQPAVAVQTLNWRNGVQWVVAHPQTGEVVERQGGAWLVNPTLEWWLQPYHGGMRIWQHGDVLIDTLPAGLHQVSFANDEQALAVGLGAGGLQYVGLQTSVRQRIFTGEIFWPAWSEDRWIVLP